MTDPLSKEAMEEFLSELPVSERALYQKWHEAHEAVMRARDAHADCVAKSDQLFASLQKQRPAHVRFLEACGLRERMPLPAVQLRRAAQEQRMMNAYKAATIELQKATDAILKNAERLNNDSPPQ